MEFKRTKIENFIQNNADELNKKEQTKNEAHLQTKMPKDIKLNFKKQIKGVWTMASFIKNALINEIEYFDNREILKIYQKANLAKISMRDFVKLRFDLIKEAKNYKESKDELTLIVISPNDKEKIEQIARNLGISCVAYTKIKLIATHELTEIFSFDEIIKLKKEAENFNLNLNEYIKLKVR